MNSDSGERTSMSTIIFGAIILAVLFIGGGCAVLQAWNVS